MKKEKYTEHLKVLAYGGLAAMLVFYVLMLIIFATIDPPLSAILGVGLVGSALVVKYVLGLLAVRIWKRL